MEPPKPHVREEDRLSALNSLGVLDTDPEKRYDQITDLVSQTLDFPIVLVSLIDENRQWFKSAFGLDARETPRNISFCGHAINEDAGHLLIPNALEDPRFSDNPLVTDAPNIRAYAGIVLRSPSGLPLGTLCAIDKKPRDLSGKTVESLKKFASVIENMLYAQVLSEARSNVSGMPLAMSVGDFAEAVNGVLTAENNSSIVFGSVSFPRYKNIQQNYGDGILNECRAELARRIRLSLSDHRFLLGHCNDYEFNFLCSYSSNIDAIEAVSEDLDVNIGRRFQTSERTIFTPVVIGLTEVDSGNQNFREILNNAHVALESAAISNSSETEIAVYKPSMSAYVDRTRSLALKLEDAIDSKQIELYFQPKVRLQDYKIVGAEALIRWNTSEFGFVPPPEIIQAAEDTGRLFELEMYVLETAIRKISHWRKSGIFSGSVSINVSEPTLLSRDLEAKLDEYHLQHALPKDALDFEILESTLLRDVGTTVSRIKSLKKRGITFSLDDFGTGYSSLSHLNSLPVETLKVDRSFISEIVESQRAAAMAHQIIGIGHTMNSKVVAEGAETFEQYLILRSLGCDVVQGYYFSRPIPAANFEDLLIANDGKLFPGQKETQKASPDAKDVIRAVSLFENLSDEEITGIANDAVHHLFQSGKTIVSKGEASDSMYIIISGEVEVVRNLSNGATLNLGRLSNSDVFGEMSLLTGEPRSASVVTSTETTILEIPKTSMQPVLNDREKMASELEKIMNKRKAKTALLFAELENDFLGGNPIEFPQKPNT